MAQFLSSSHLNSSPFLQNYFCVIEGCQAAFVYISKNASTYLKSIAIYAKTGMELEDEEEIHACVGFTPQNGYLIPVTEMPQYEKEHGEFLKFAVWRDPIERLVSNFKWFIQEKNWRIYFNWLSLYNDCSFERFLEFTRFELGKSDSLSQDEHIRRQSDYYLPQDVDAIIPLKELDTFLRQHNIPVLKNKQNRSRKTVVEITPRQKDIIRNVYSDDYSLVNGTCSLISGDNLENEMIHHLILKSSFCKAPGLMNGKMGIAIMFFIYGRHKKNDIYTDIAEELIEDIWTEMPSEISCNFYDGLCGIGWGIEYLIQQNYIEGDSNEICEDIDRRIQQIHLADIDDQSLGYGLEGIARYVGARRQGNFQQNTSFPFDERFIQELVGLCPSFDEFLINGGRNDLEFIWKTSALIGRATPKSYLSCSLGLDGLSGYLLKIIQA